jgi:uncharacterized protein YxjI
MIDLTQYSELIVKQEVERLEAFTGIETKNKYSINTPDGDRLMFAYEESGFLARMFLRKHRPLALHIVDGAGQPLFSASRGFFWFVSHLHVRDGDDRPVGSLRRRFAVLNRRFDLEDPSGSPIAEIRGSLFRPNTFKIERKGDEIAKITKQWGGVLREAFTDADTFRVELHNGAVDSQSAMLVLAAAIAIDLDFFESGGGGTGLGG